MRERELVGRALQNGRNIGHVISISAICSCAHVIGARVCFVSGGELAVSAAFAWPTWEEFSRGFPPGNAAD